MAQGVGQRRRYTRETLLSFRDLPTSQNLPDSVDEELLGYVCSIHVDLKPCYNLFMRSQRLV